jgi:hypothetical protein
MVELRAAVPATRATRERSDAAVEMVMKRLAAT